MVRPPFGPVVQVFVCTNRREPSSPLGPGCGDAGQRVYDALKREVSRRGLVVSTWITATRCLGVCPSAGCAVARYPGVGLLSEITIEDVAYILSPAAGGAKEET